MKYIAIGISFLFLGFVLGNIYPFFSPETPIVSSESGTTSIKQNINTTSLEEKGTTSTETITQKEDVVPKAPVPTLNKEQEKLLKSLGVDPDAVEITNAMIVCAEKSVGVERVSEIKQGALPTMTESMLLLACYKKGE
jgi:hypothetical protein